MQLFPVFRRFLANILNYLATSSCIYATKFYTEKMWCFSFKWILFIRLFFAKCSDYFLVHSDVIFSFRYFITTVYSRLHLVCYQRSPSRQWIARFQVFSVTTSWMTKMILMSFIMLIYTISLLFWKCLPIIKAIFYYVLNNRKLQTCW